MQAHWVDSSVRSFLLAGSAVMTFGRMSYTKALQHTVVAILLAISCTAAKGEMAGIAVEDLVRFATIGNIDRMDGFGAVVTEPATFSPGGEHAAVLVRRGDPQSQANIGELLIYRTSEQLGRAPGKKIVDVASTSNSQPLGLVRWTADG